jgi:hypothetical protein
MLALSAGYGIDGACVSWVSENACLLVKCLSLHSTICLPHAPPYRYIMSGCKRKCYRVWDGRVIVIALVMDVISMGVVKAALKITLPHTSTSSPLSKTNHLQRMLNWLTRNRSAQLLRSTLFRSMLMHCIISYCHWANILAVVLWTLPSALSACYW